MNEYLVVCSILYSFWGDGGGAGRRGKWRRQKVRRGREEGVRRDRRGMRVGRDNGELVYERIQIKV